MDLAEFLRRWDQMPALKHAELIEGVVHLASPVSLIHADFDHLFHAWLSRYEDTADGLGISGNCTCILNGNSFQPDLALRRVTAPENTKYIERPPGLIIEICYSSRSYDMYTKLAAYKLAGVAEYMTVLIEDKRVDWRILNEGRYDMLEPNRAGFLESPTFPGLRLDTGAVFPPDIKRMKAALSPNISMRT